MKVLKVIGIFCLVAFLSVFVACAKPPNEEIDAANSAMSRAEADADTREYAPDSLSSAKSLIARMEAEVAAKNYDSARNLALQAANAAEKAIRDGAAAKAKAQTDTASLVSSAKTALAEVQRSFSSARNLRGIALDIPAIESEIQEAGQAIASAESALAQSDFKTAGDRAQNARTLIAGTNSTITNAVQAATRRK